METSPVTLISQSSMPALIPLRFPGSKDIYTSYEGPLNLVKTEPTINTNTQSTQENTPFIFKVKENNSTEMLKVLISEVIKLVFLYKILSLFVEKPS